MGLGRECPGHLGWGYLKEGWVTSFLCLLRKWPGLVSCPKDSPSQKQKIAGNLWSFLPSDCPIESCAAEELLNQQPTSLTTALHHLELAQGTLLALVL